MKFMVAWNIWFLETRVLLKHAIVWSTYSSEVLVVVYNVVIWSTWLFEAYALLKYHLIWSARGCLKHNNVFLKHCAHLKLTWSSGLTCMYSRVHQNYVGVWSYLTQVQALARNSSSYWVRELTQFYSSRGSHNHWKSLEWTKNTREWLSMPSTMYCI